MSQQQETLEQKRQGLPRLQIPSRMSSISRGKSLINHNSMERCRPLSTVSTTSEKSWNYDNPLPSVRRSNARAGNGKAKHRSKSPSSSSSETVVADQSDSDTRRSKRSSTFSYNQYAGVNKSEKSVEGYDSKSFASRGRACTVQPDNRKGNYGQIVPSIHPDFNPINGTPTMRTREITDMDNYRDNQVRLSRIHADFAGAEGMPEHLMPQEVKVGDGDNHHPYKAALIDITGDKPRQVRRKPRFHEDLVEARKPSRRAV